ncbi:MAG: hydroxymethylbilane synthase [Planctomycetota bacterium]
MTAELRLGTRGSELAMVQARWIAERLRSVAGIRSRLEIISTTGDQEQLQPSETRVWSMGAFVKEIESALLDRRIDLAVHSYKDMAATSTPGLLVAAVPARAAPHDLLVFAGARYRETVQEALAENNQVSDLIVGTSSPRRSAQLSAALGARIVPLRGNVPTRLAKLAHASDTDDIHAVSLAAAGLERLGIAPKHALALDIDRFPTAAAQGALAVQVRDDAPWAQEVFAIEDESTRRATDAERSFLRAINAGCHTPAAAHAVNAGPDIRLHAEMFDDSLRRAHAICRGQDPMAIGLEAGTRVLACL